MYAYKGIKSCKSKSSFSEIACQTTQIFLVWLFSVCFRFLFLQPFSLLIYWYLRWFYPRLLFQHAVCTVLLNRAAQSNDSAVSRRTSTTVEDQAVRRGGDVTVPGTCPRECIFLQKHAWVGGGSAPALVWRRKGRAGLMDVMAWIHLLFSWAKDHRCHALSLRRISPLQSWGKALGLTDRPCNVVMEVLPS